MYEKLRSRLEQLTVEEIEQFQSYHPENRTLTVVCNGVIREKKEKAEIQKSEELEREIALIIAKRNAPDGAATPSQGNETR